MEKCYILFRNDRIYIKTQCNKKFFEFTINNQITYPNVPLYYEVFSNEKIIKELKTFVRENINKTFMHQIFAKKVFLLIPDDVTDVTDFERRAFDVLAKRLIGGKRVIMGSECAFVAPFEENEYICISKTCRMMILSYIKDKNIFKQNFIENKEYTNEELYVVISELHGGVECTPKIYLNGIDLSRYSDLGIIIDSLELINNFEAILNIVKIK